MSTIDDVDWVFGIVFLFFVAGSCLYLLKTSQRNRGILLRIPRITRLRQGVLASVSAIALGFSAVWIAASQSSWERTQWWVKPAIFFLMAGFVLLQTFAAMVFISLAVPDKKP